MKRLTIIIACGVLAASALYVGVKKSNKPYGDFDTLDEKLTYHCDAHTESLDAHQSYEKMIQGYDLFRKKYVDRNTSIMQCLAHHGQKPHTMIIACCDSRVDPALILQCDPGDLFVVRNVANIVAPCEKDHMHHGTSAALEFAIQTLKVKHLIILGHSQCGGILAAMSDAPDKANNFVNAWVSLIKMHDVGNISADEYAKLALLKSYEYCLTFPWIQEKLAQKELMIHLWFFDIKSGQIVCYSEDEKMYKPLDAVAL